jgi:phosphinothricin acetyltransferase
MAEICIRPAVRSDLPRLTEIYNYYVLHTAITFDIEPFTAEQRVAWFEQFATTGRHRLIVAEDGGLVVGYAGTMRFRAKPAYDTTVETTIYCAHDMSSKGIGSRLYAGLFEAIAREDIHRIMGAFTLPNVATEKLHERFGFRRLGVFGECGRKFGRYWDVAWTSRPLRVGPGEKPGREDWGGVETGTGSPYVFSGID